MRPIPQRAIDFIKASEGVELEAYLDVAGVPTIGWGHTKGVALGQVITEDQAVAFLQQDLARAAEAMAAVVKPEILARLTDAQYSALLSFGFNLGVDRHDGIWDVVNGGELDRVPARMLLYNKARVHGKLVKVQGLVNRRLAEAALWEEGQGEAIVLTAYKAETPATPREKPPQKSFSLLAVIGSAFAGGWAFLKDQFAAVVAFLTPDNINSGIATIQPYADKSTIAASVLQGLAVLGTIIAGVLLWRKNQKGRK